MEERPFNILGLQQIAIGSKDKERLHGLWLDLFGLNVSEHHMNEAENVHEDKVMLGSGKLTIELDLMQPIDPEKTPKVHTPALNHLGLWVDDLDAAIEWLTGRGVRFTPGGIRMGASGHEVAFIHPKANDKFPFGGEGVLIELVQAPPEVIEMFDEEKAHSDRAIIKAG